MSKFIQTVDDEGHPVIINLESISHATKILGRLKIFFHTDYSVFLKGTNADFFWEFLSAQSFHVYQQPQEDKK